VVFVTSVSRPLSGNTRNVHFHFGSYKYLGSGSHDPT
jgi:hypothetical protein